jgi:hypothetical protein
MAINGTDGDKADKTKPPPVSSARGSSGLTIGGLVMIYLAAAAFLWTGYYEWSQRSAGRIHWVQFVPEMVSCSIGIFAALLGVKLVRAGGASSSDPLPVVNPEEWSILSGAITNRDDPIGEYIRLSSLTGATGFFRKLDLSGLPLATIALTLVFALGMVAFPTGKFYELTQLTLGAFIGSFVQKQVGALRDVKVPLPQGDTGGKGNSGDGNGNSGDAKDPAGDTGGGGAKTGARR